MAADRSRETTVAQGIGRDQQRRGVPRPPPLSLYTGGGREMNNGTVANSTTTATTGDSGDNRKRMLSKQLSMKETSREVKWEKRRRQIHRQRSSMPIHLDGAHYHEVSTFSSYNVAVGGADSDGAAKGSLTDEDLDELKGSMELGFGFDEENGGQNLCDTLPALDLYFAVNRQLSEPKMRVSTSLPSMSALSYSPSTPSPRSPVAQPSLLDSLKICSPAGDNPQVVKTRLRHWAQVVACSVKHSS